MEVLVAALIRVRVSNFGDRKFVRSNATFPFIAIPLILEYGLYVGRRTLLFSVC